MKVPKIDWIPFDKNNPPVDLIEDGDYLIFLREDDYNNGATWTYHVDIATPYGSYLDNFWDTTNDWDEGQRIEVLAYAETPYGLKKEDLVDDDRTPKPVERVLVEPGCVERNVWGRVEKGMKLCRNCGGAMDSHGVCHATKKVHVPVLDKEDLIDEK